MFHWTRFFVSTEKNHLPCYQFSIQQLNDKERHKLQNQKTQQGYSQTMLNFPLKTSSKLSVCVQIFHNFPQCTLSFYDRDDLKERLFLRLIGKIQVHSNLTNYKINFCLDVFIRNPRMISSKIRSPVARKFLPSNFTCNLYTFGWTPFFSKSSKFLRVPGVAGSNLPHLL